MQFDVSGDTEMITLRYTDFIDFVFSDDVIERDPQFAK